MSDGPPAIEQTGFGKDEGSRAHRDHAARLWTGQSQPVGHGGFFQGHAAASRDDDGVPWGVGIQIGESGVCHDPQPRAAAHYSRVLAGGERDAVAFGRGSALIGLLKDVGYPCRLEEKPLFGNDEKNGAGRHSRCLRSSSSRMVRHSSRDWCLSCSSTPGSRPSQSVSPRAMLHKKSPSVDQTDGVAVGRAASRGNVVVLDDFDDDFGELPLFGEVGTDQRMIEAVGEYLGVEGGSSRVGGRSRPACR